MLPRPRMAEPSVMMATQRCSQVYSGGLRRILLDGETNARHAGRIDVSQDLLRGNRNARAHLDLAAAMPIEHPIGPADEARGGQRVEACAQLFLPAFFDLDGELPERAALFAMQSGEVFEDQSGFGDDVQNAGEAAGDLLRFRPGGFRGSSCCSTLSDQAAIFAQLSVRTASRILRSCCQQLGMHGWTYARAGARPLPRRPATRGPRRPCRPAGGRRTAGLNNPVLSPLKVGHHSGPTSEDPRSPLLLFRARCVLVLNRRHASANLNTRSRPHGGIHNFHARIPGHGLLHGRPPHGR